ncbi:MAG: dihydropteroate synthase [Vulcanimicrobiaceae bacterium]
MRTSERGALCIRGRRLVWGERTYIMGIVNATPDSFSGDGRVDVTELVAYARAQWAAGSDILDIGGESTRPGHHAVDENTESERVVPAIAAVRAALPDAILSVDTYKPAVARAAHDAGADMVNCVWGMPDALLKIAVECRMPVIIMHNRPDTAYAGDVVDEVLAFLSEAAQRAVQRGIPTEDVIVDPGIGFGKTAEQNLTVLAGLARLRSLGVATLLGASRKSTIGRLTGRKPQERTHGTDATTALAIAAGIDIVRVHDVAAARDVAGVADAVVRGWRPAGWIE